MQNKQKTIPNKYSKFKTGDLLLFNNNKPSGLSGLFTHLIQYGTHSDYSHVAMILKDPTFISPVLKGTFVWESSWEGKPDPQDGKIKLGVQITPLQEILDAYAGEVAIYRGINLDTPNDFFTEENLKNIHDVVYDKPYDIIPTDWIGALFHRDAKPQKTDRFWCSALVGYIYTKCGILEADTDWSILRPSDFSVDGENLKLCKGVTLSNSQTKIV